MGGGSPSKVMNEAQLARRVTWPNPDSYHGKCPAPFQR